MSIDIRKERNEQTLELSQTRPQAQTITRAHTTQTRIPLGEQRQTRQPRVLDINNWKNQRQSEAGFRPNRFSSRLNAASLGLENVGVL